MNTENKDSESELFKDFNEAIENKKEEKQAEKTGLNKDDIQYINITKGREQIKIIKNPNNEIIEKPRQKTKYYPVQKSDKTMQTNFNPIFLKEKEDQNANEPKFIPPQNKVGGSQMNKKISSSLKTTDKKYLGKKTKNNSPENKKTTKNNQCNNKSKLLQDKNKNIYALKSKENININPNKDNVNKEICKNTGSNIGTNINTYKLSFVNKYLSQNHDNNNPNYIFKYTEVKKLVDIGLFNSKEKDELTILNFHDIHDYKDLYDLSDFHEFHEEQRIFQQNLNNYYGY